MNLDLVHGPLGPIRTNGLQKGVVNRINTLSYSDQFRAKKNPETLVFTRLRGDSERET